MKQIAAALAVAVLAAACSSGPAAPASTPTVAASGMPFSIDKIVTSFDGTAFEVLQVPSYTYVAVKTGEGDVRWVASLKKPIRVGDAVHVRSFGEKADWRSAKLNGRVFPRVYFAVVTNKNVNQG